MQHYQFYYLRANRKDDQGRKLFALIMNEDGTPHVDSGLWHGYFVDCSDKFREVGFTPGFPLNVCGYKSFVRCSYWQAWVIDKITHYRHLFGGTTGDFFHYLDTGRYGWTWQEIPHKNALPVLKVRADEVVEGMRILAGVRNEKQEGHVTRAHERGTGYFTCLDFSCETYDRNDALSPRKDFVSSSYLRHGLVPVTGWRWLDESYEDKNTYKENA